MIPLKTRRKTRLAKKRERTLPARHQVAMEAKPIVVRMKAEPKVRPRATRQQGSEGSVDG